VYDLVRTPLEESRDVFVREESLSLGFNYAFFNLLDHFHVSPICSLPSISPKHSLDVPNDNLMICDSNVDLGHEDNIFSMLGGNDHDYLSLGYLRGYDPSIDPYCISLEDLPRKITWTSCFNPFYDFLWALIRLRGYLYSLV